MKGTKQDLNKWTDILLSQIGRLSIVKRQLPTKFVFFNIEKLIPKCVWKGKETRIAKTILGRQNKVGGY